MMQGALLAAAAGAQAAYMMNHGLTLEAVARASNGLNLREKTGI